MTTPYSTLSDVRSWLTGISQVQTSDDPLITELIDRASAFIDSYVGRGILSQTVTEIRHGNGSSGMYVLNYPITAVSNVTVGAYSYSSALDLTSTGFTFDNNMIWLRGGKFYRGINNVRISYTGGYTTVPADIAQACIELVVFKYKQRNRIGVVSHSQNNMVVDSFIQTDVPPEVQVILDRYKRTATL